VSVACGAGSPAGVDVEALERAVPALLVPEHPEMVVDVSCPTIEVDAAGPVTCSATIAGLVVPIVVYGPDEDSRMKVESEVELVMAAEVASSSETRLDADLGIDNEVGCEPVLRVARAGQSFTCTATEPDGRAHVLIATLLDGTGAFRLDPG